ncbi:MAG: zinc ribbon domain-containing protein [Phycisphaera sp.]|nr:MAG: zinc ribbon domain-containing protein [Phycisphaera sp.]
MPTYDYRCNACDHEFELFQSMSDSVKRTCPKCGKRKLERLIGTGAALLFKGSGFYETDYRSESYKKDQKADKPETKSESKADSKPDSKSDSKPDKKTEKKPDAKPDKKPKAASK